MGVFNYLEWIFPIRLTMIVGNYLSQLVLLGYSLQLPEGYGQTN